MNQFKIIEAVLARHLCTVAMRSLDDKLEFDAREVRFLAEEITRALSEHNAADVETVRRHISLRTYNASDSDREFRGEALSALDRLAGKS